MMIAKIDWKLCVGVVETIKYIMARRRSTTKFCSLRDDGAGGMVVVTLCIICCYL
jgi:hypothetical protein